MNLPPFPVLPLTPEERILWIDWGERVAAAERERAAQVCESFQGDGADKQWAACTLAAAAIRKGNQQEGK
jgi:hypothetical protein